MIRLTLLAAIAALCVATTHASLAMEFQRSGTITQSIWGTSEVIHASGTIEHGDAQKFTPRSEVIPTVKMLRQQIIAARFGSDPKASVLNPLSDRDALDMVLPSVGSIKPILDARVVNLERGAGFYYDQCFAILGEGMVSVALVDLVSHVVTLRGFDALQQRWVMFDDKSELW